MSKILDSFKKAEDHSVRCHVRVSDNMTYGPVALSTVCQWAEQGRITSESEISFNRKEWVRADAIPELGLDWTASDKGNTHGPFHLHTLVQLVRRGVVAPDARLTHRDSGETLDVQQALTRAEESRPLDAAATRLRNATAPASGQSLVSHAASMVANAAPPSPAVDDSTQADEVQDPETIDTSATQRITELEEECDRLRSENTRFASELEAAVTRQSEGEVALDKRTKELTALQKRTDEEAAQRTAQLRQLESNLHEVTTTLKERQEEIEILNQTRTAEQAQAAEQIEGLKSGLESANQHHDAREAELSTQIAELEQQLAETREQAAQREADDGLKIDERDKTFARLNQDLTEAQARIKELTADACTLKSELESARREITAQERQLSEQDAALKETSEKLATEKTALAEAKADAEAAHKAATEAAAPGKPETWYLRYDAENTLGPVSFNELVTWVKDCRVAPDHDVSSDQIFWAKACDVPGLEMDWMVTLIDGTPYGPINKLAVRDLIADGTVAEDAELTHCKRGEKLSASSVKA